MRIMESCDFVSDCCHAPFDETKEYDDCYPERGRFYLVLRCTSCGSVCGVAMKDKIEKDNGK